MHKFPAIWNLKDAVFTKDKGKVFSCFSCAGGSTMGYKLAGFDVIGCVEIDDEILRTYQNNHHPKYAFGLSIQYFKKLIKHKVADGQYSDLMNLDILDGSPPCSSFSIAGDRDLKWGEKKKFREGQQEQVLDTLFFDFIELADFLKPKIVIAENVKGLMMGKAREYVRKIYRAFDEAGYTCQHFLLDARRMGVPQIRERVIFLALRKDLAEPFMKPIDMFEYKPFIDMRFDEPDIPFGEVRSEVGDDQLHTERGQSMLHAIEGDRDMNDINKRIHNKISGFTCKIRYDHEISGTITASERDFRFCDKMAMSEHDYKVCATFPLDFKLLNHGKHEESYAKYITGMSVPPVMMAQIASRVYDYWLSKLNEFTKSLTNS